MSLRIALVAHSFPPYVGGLSHVIEMLSLNLVKEGNDVEVITLDPSGKLKDHDEFGGVRVKRFPCLAPAGSYFLPSPKVVDYIRSLDNGKVDIVHAHNLGALLVLACWFAVRGNHCGFVLSPHHHAEGSLWHTRMLWKPYMPIARHVVQSADVVHCVSDFEAQLVRKDFGVEPVVVENGVAEDVSRYSWHPPEDRLVLVYAGRVEGYKRVDVLLKSASIISRRGRHDVVVRIIGDGQALSGVIQLSKMLGVAVEHYPFVARDEYLRLLSTSSCFVNPSMYEAFSMVTAEALAMGLPAVVSTPWGETFRGHRGLRVAEGNSAEKVARAIVASSSSIDTGPPYGTLQTWGEVARRLINEICTPALGTCNAFILNPPPAASMT